MLTFQTLIFLISRLLVIVFFARFIAQMIDPRGANPITRFLTDLTEPILAPIRRIVPSMGGFDFSPTIVLLLLFFLSQAVR